MANFTVRALDAARPKEKEFKLTVDRGLYLRVAPDGVKTWHVRYVVAGKQKQLKLPAPYGNGVGFFSLAEAVAENARIQALARSGLDPQEQEEQIRREAERIKRIEEQRALTVQNLFDAWVLDGVARQDLNAELKRLFSKDVLPVIGERQLLKLSDKDILEVLRRMIQRGVTRLAVIAYNDMNQMLAWGEKRQPWRPLMGEGNPCDLVDVHQLLPEGYEDERDRVLSAAELCELRDIFENMKSSWLQADDRRVASRPFAKKSQIALWLCLGTLCRIGELLMARWEHVDLEQGVWYIPRENVKGRRGKKQEHYVFLSDFTRRQFEALKEITGKTEWCFPSKNRKGEVSHVCLKSVSKQVGDRQIMFKQRSAPLKGRAFDNALVLAKGANGEWTPHDLRRTGATMMQALGISLDVIDRCQNHLLAGGRVRRVYLRHNYEIEKTQAWQTLGDSLDSLLQREEEGL